MFGLGSRTPISITLLVKNPRIHREKAEIFYHDIGTYCPQVEKLRKIKEFGSILNPEMKLSSITPNEAGDWLNQRDGLFETFIPLGAKGDKNAKTIFSDCYSCGVKTNRDSWVYNFSRFSLEKNVSSMIDFYNSQVDAYAEAEKHGETDITKILDWDRAKFSWDYAQKERDIPKKRKYTFCVESVYQAVYRPFVKEWLYFDRDLNNRVYQMPRIFPTPQTKNLVICVSGIGGKSFSTLMTDCVSDLHVLESGTQCFPLYYYEVIERDQLGLFDSYEDEYVRHDAISDFVLKQAQALYGPKCAKEDIFYYIYGFLHSKDYRHRFAADLIKMLPRIPLCENVKTFKSFSAAGRELALLHTNYETAEKWTDAIVSGADTSFIIEKMRWAKNNSEDDKRTIVLAPGVRIENIPLQAYEYLINGKSAIEWLMERYQYTVNLDSQISNNPNAWGIEHNQPHYILDLLLRVIAVSMKTVQLVAQLPEVDFSNPS